MSIIEVLNRGAQVRNEHGDAAKLTYLERRSLLRFAQLHWRLDARRIDLRAANRRYRRRRGLSIKGV